MTSSPAAWRLALLLLAVATAGCAADAPPATAPGTEEPPAPTPWRVGTRVFDVPSGASYGALLLRFEAADGRPRDGGSTFGIRLDLGGLSPDAYVAAYALSVADGVATWQAAAAAHGNEATLGLAAGDGTDSPTSLFLVAVHQAAPGVLRVANWGPEEATFGEPLVAGAWTAAGPAEVSYYEERPAEPPRSHGVDVQRVVEPAVAPASAGRLVLTTQHNLSSGLTFSTMGGAARIAGGIDRVSWTNAGETRTLDAPAVAAGPSLIGYWLLDENEGTHAVSVASQGGSVERRLGFAHVSVAFDGEPLGIGVAPVFRDRIPDVEP